MKSLSSFINEARLRDYKGEVHGITNEPPIFVCIGRGKLSVSEYDFIVMASAKPFTNVTRDNGSCIGVCTSFIGSAEANYEPGKMIYKICEGWLKRWKTGFLERSGMGLLSTSDEKVERILGDSRSYAATKYADKFVKDLLEVYPQRTFEVVDNIGEMLDYVKEYK